MGLFPVDRYPKTKGIDNLMIIGSSITLLLMGVLIGIIIGRDLLPNKRQNEKCKPPKLVMLLSKSPYKIDTVTLYVDTFRYTQP